MKLEWIDDILAVIDTGSLAKAAERRFLTQSAFTRRVRAIEQNIGTVLFDRSKKPVVLMSGVLALEPELRQTSARLRRLRADLRGAAADEGSPVSLVCQHAITTTISPYIVKELSFASNASVRVRSGNRDQCLLHLLSGEADLAVTYQGPEERNATLHKAFEVEQLGVDLLMPVCSPNVLADLTLSAIPAIGYPPDVFLGRVFDQFIAPRMAEGSTLVPVAETALTLAACEYALADMGVAWLPKTLVKPHLQSGRLCNVEQFPAQELAITMVRMFDAQSERTDDIWQHLTENSILPANL